MSIHKRFVTGMIVVAAAVLWCGTARAQSYWTNTASGLLPWSTTANWTNTVPVQYGSVSTILNFSVPGTYTSSNNWTGIFTNNGMVFGAGTVTNAGGTLAFMNNDTVMPVVTNFGATVTIKNPLLLATNTTFAGASNTTASGVISGSGGIIQAGSGTLTLSGANTYTGGTTINNGSTLAASVAGSLGTSSSGPLVVNGILNLTAGAATTYTFSNSISGNGTINVTVGSSDQYVTLRPIPLLAWTNFVGTLNIGVNQSASSGGVGLGNVSFPSGAIVKVTSNSTLYLANSTNAAALNLYGGTLGSVVGSEGQIRQDGGIWSGNIKLFADTSLGSHAATIIISGNIEEDGGSCGLRLLPSASGKYIYLSGTNTYSGDTRLQLAGGVVINNALALQNSTLDMNAADTASIGFGQNSTLGGLKGSRTLNMGGFTLRIGNNNKNTTYSGVLTNGAVIKSGTGLLELSGTNTYRGGTTVSNGTLAINGVITGAVTVATGGTLGGTGMVSGVVTNFGAIGAFDTSTIGRLTVSNLVMKPSSSYAWNYTTPANTEVYVNGSLSLPSVVTVNVSQVSGKLPNPGVLFTGFSSVNTSNLTEWVIKGALITTRAKVEGNQVVLVSPRGCVLYVE